jgi:DNA-binding NarL/FixJ family response regulator
VREKEAARFEPGSKLPVPDGCELIIDGERYAYLVLSEGKPPALPDLTSAEQDVAWRAAEGESTKIIAKARGTSVRTVDHQLATIFRKLKVGSRHELGERIFRTPREC